MLFMVTHLHVYFENIVNLILSEVVFMKSTSRHKNNGILYYNNFSPIENYPKNKIENHILGTLIKNYFITK